MGNDLIGWLPDPMGLHDAPTATSQTTLRYVMKRGEDQVVDVSTETDAMKQIHI